MQVSDFRASYASMFHCVTLQQVLHDVPHLMLLNELMTAGTSYATGIATLTLNSRTQETIFF